MRRRVPMRTSLAGPHHPRQLRRGGQPGRRDVIPTEAEILRRYQEGAVEAMVLLRFNLWETLDFDDLTPSVRATVERIELAISESRAALLSAVSHDPGITEREVARITHDVIIPHQTGRLKR